MTKFIIQLNRPETFVLNLVQKQGPVGPEGPAGSGEGGSLNPIAANTILGNNTASSALPTGLTPAQTLTLLNAVAITFETISKSLNSYPYSISYNSGKISTIIYTILGPTTITKTINYTGDKITSIVLSGSTPSGISLTKTFTYTSDNITGVAYS